MRASAWGQFGPELGIEVTSRPRRDPIAIPALHAVVYEHPSLLRLTATGTVACHAEFVGAKASVCKTYDEGTSNDLRSTEAIGSLAESKENGQVSAPDGL